ncbi:hypothetical protein [Comamonas sp. GB3 AK4-5]|uniref:hypothetical protein n=1 Tax=Comamonas sp. GB3 AK4-5 TaxID=3231487 RepID=UPI00351EF79C
MNALCAPDASRQQRWLACGFLLLMLGALAPILVRSFVPATGWQRMALVLSLVLAAATGLLLRRWHRLGLWRPGGPWLHYSPRKRCLMLPLCVAFTVFILWLNLALTLPMAYTRWLGQEVQQSTTAHKKRGSSRRACSHQLRLTHVDYWLFEFCVDRSDFDALPDGPLPVDLQGRRSMLGTWVRAVQLQRGDNTDPDPLQRPPPP